MKRTRLLVLCASSLLVVGTAGAQTVVFNPGVLRHQYWTSDNPNGVQSPTRAQVENGQAGAPATDTIDLTVFDTADGGAVNYAERVSGLFIPTVTTNYVFWVNSDDDSDLFVSTDATPANKKLVAQEAGWSNVDQWHAVGSAGGSSAAQKRSDQFSPDGGATVPFKNGIPMVAGQKYWIEGVHHQGTGGENFGATFSIKGGAEPTDGVPSALNVTNIGYGYTIPTTLTVVTQATNTTTSDGREASFTYVVADPIPDPLLYQWYRNGTVISNATYQQYTFLASAADNSAQYTCVVGLPASYNVSTTYTSSVAVLTVNANSISYTNGLKIERFNNFVRTDAENRTTGPASNIEVSTGDGSATLPIDRTGAESVSNDAINNFASRMSGWYIPPADGDYVFFLSSDDDSDLFLSTDATPAKLQLIAQENVWSNSRNWTNSPGGSIVSQKRSDQWTNTDGTGVAPFASGIHLLGGHPYYIEADYHQGGGGDNLGILAKLVTDPDPTNGAPPIPASQLSMKTTAATNLVWKTLPHNVSVFDGNQAIFSGSATSDSEFDVLYQWQRNGTNIPGATTTSYSILTAIASDSGSTFDLIASTAEGDLSITSSPVTLTVQTAVFEPGLVLMQYWLNKGADLTVPESGAFGPPDFTMAVPAMEAGNNNENGNTYVNELSGFIVPAVSQAYDFYVSSDDHSDVFLSTDSNPNNKRLICQQPGWSDALEWSDTSGNNSDSDRNQMDSGTYTNAAGAKLNPNGIQLTAGTKYYMEVWHQEGGGGDNVGVTWAKHGDPRPADKTDSALTGSLIGFNAPNTSTFVAFTNQPADQQALSGTTATFSAGGISDGKIPIGTTGLFNNSGDVPNVAKFVSFPNVLFQWFKNGTLIPGATTSSYTTPQLHPGDSAQYYAQIRALGLQNWSNSLTATLTVIADTNKPTVVFVSEFDDNLNAVVSVTFSKAMDLASISDMSHYNLTGAQIANIVVNSNDARHVQLQLGGEPTSFPLQLTISGITDFSGNPPTATSFSVPQAELINLDVGDFTVPDPAFPGYMWATGTNAYDIMCEGSDIWNAADGFNYSYETKTGDFDVAVRQTAFTKPDNYSKGGLMVREDLSPGSRNWNIVNDPSSADGLQSVNGNGLGQNTVECNTRSTNSQASLGWATGPATVPAYPNAWVRLKRAGTLLSAYWSSNGVSWVQEALTDLSTNANGPLPQTVYIGICCTAHDNDAQTVVTPIFYYNASFDHYNSSFVAVNLPTISVAHSGSTVTITYSGTLLSSGTVNGTYTPVSGAASPYTVPTGASPAQFYKTQ